MSSIVLSILRKPLVLSNPTVLRGVLDCGYVSAPHFVIRGECNVNGDNLDVYILATYCVGSQNVRYSILKATATNRVNLMEENVTTSQFELNGLPFERILGSLKTLGEVDALMRAESENSVNIYNGLSPNVASEIRRLTARLSRVLYQYRDCEIGSEELGSVSVSYVLGGVIDRPIERSGSKKGIISLRRSMEIVANILGEEGKADELIDLMYTFDKENVDNVTVILFYRFMLFAYEYLDCTDANMVSEHLESAFINMLSHTMSTEDTLKMSLDTGIIS